MKCHHQIHTSRCDAIGKLVEIYLIGDFLFDKLFGIVGETQRFFLILPCKSSISCHNFDMKAKCMYHCFPNLILY